MEFLFFLTNVFVYYTLPRNNTHMPRSKSSLLSLEDDSISAAFREWTRLQRGTCKHESYPKRKRNESAVDYETRVIQVLQDHSLGSERVHACLASQVARDSNLPKQARTFVEEGFRDMRARMKNANKDEILKAYRDIVRKYHDDVKNGVPKQRAHRTFSQRKVKLVDKVKGVKIWDRRTYSTARMARQIMDHSKYQRAVSALTALNQRGLPENLKRAVLNRTNMSAYPIRRPVSPKPRARSSALTPPPRYASNGNNNNNGSRNGAGKIPPKSLSDSFRELTRQKERNYQTFLRTGSLPNGPSHEPTLSRKQDLYTYAESKYFDLPLTKYALSTFSNQRELIRYLRDNPFSNDPTWSRLRRFVLSMN